MNHFLERAKQLEAQMQEDRHYLHKHAEAGEHLPETVSYVMNRLREIGRSQKKYVHPVFPHVSKVHTLERQCSCGRTWTLCQWRKPMIFRFKVTNAAHNCGHDLHTAMLLGAAQILFEHRNDLHGNVKLMFQPAEELFIGSRKMIEAGILSNPHVDVAMGMHVMLDTTVPSLNYGTGYMTSSCNGFKITVHGSGCHGAMPHLGIDPINAGLHIYSAFQNLIARECDPSEKVSLTFGAFQAGSTTNIVPDQAILMGTLRTYNKQLREQLVKRMQEICEYTGKAFHVSVDYVTVSDVPSTYSDPELTTDLAEYASDIIPDFICDTNYKVTPSDDFAFISEQVPTAYFMIGCQVEGCSVQHHNPGVLFDEAVLPYGAATHAACAFHWLNKEN